MQHNGNTFLGIGLALLLASAAFFSGLHMGQGMAPDGQMEAGLFSIFAAPNDAPVEGVDLGEFWRVWNLLDAKYVSGTSSDPVSTDERVQGAIQGLVEAYDDSYTVFLPPEDAEQFEDNISGNFSGVGMEVGMRDGLITIIAPLVGTPAEAAGILAGDVIIAIDGTSTEDMNVNEAVKLIRGEVGTEVVLTIFREGETEFKEIAIIRDVIDIPTIKTEMRDGVFIITLYNFNALAEMKMQQALREFVQSDADQLVLDVRGNPGGFLQSAVAIASYFLPTGKVIVREHFGEAADDQVFRSQGRVVHDFSSDDFVVLIDGGSASASEILAGALMEHEVATVIGEPTFGKGSVQELVPLPSGASLKVTVARWLTPDGVSFSEGGLEPQHVVSRSPQQIVAGEDPQLEAALAWLAGERDIADPVLPDPAAAE